MKNKLASISVEKWRKLLEVFESTEKREIEFSRKILDIKNQNPDSICNLVSMLVDFYTEAIDNGETDKAASGIRYFIAIIKNLSPEQKEGMYDTFVKDKYNISALVNLQSFLEACHDRVNDETAVPVDVGWEFFKKKAFPYLNEK